MLATPVRNTIIRTSELAADYHGLNAAREPGGFATTALKRSEYRKRESRPGEERIFLDHPGGDTRMLTAMRRKAGHLDESARVTLGRTRRDRHRPLAGNNSSRTPSRPMAPAATRSITVLLRR